MSTLPITLTKISKADYTIFRKARTAFLLQGVTVNDSSFKRYTELFRERLPCASDSCRRLLV